MRNTEGEEGEREREIIAELEYYYAWIGFTLKFYGTNRHAQ